MFVGVGGGGEEVLGYIEYDSSLLASCIFIVMIEKKEGYLSDGSRQIWLSIDRLPLLVISFRVDYVVELLYSFFIFSFFLSFVFRPLPVVKLPPSGFDYILILST